MRLPAAKRFHLSQRAMGDAGMEGQPAARTWRSGRSHDGSELDLTDRWWENANPVDWSTEHKQVYLLRVWQDVLAAIDNAAAAAVATAATA